MSTTKPQEIRLLGEYQRLLERFETFNDGFILPDLFLVLRMDARRFGPAWDDVPDGEYPFGARVGSAFFATGRRLMNAGFRVTYSFISGDEISLLLDPLESVNQRRRSKLLSVISSTAAVLFQEESGLPVVFHTKLSELPSRNHVIDYFLWQKKVSTRNFYSKTLGAILASKGLSAREVDAKIGGLSEHQQKTFGEELGVFAADVEPWKRLGSAIWWEPDTQPGGMPFKLVQCRSLPESDTEYLSFLEERVSAESYLSEQEGKALDAAEAEPVVRAAPKAQRPQKKSEPRQFQPQQPGLRTPFRLAHGVQRHRGPVKK